MRRSVLFFALYTFAIVAVFFVRPFILKTDILDVAPTVREDAEVTEALDRLTRAYTNRLNILFGASELSNAKNAGVFFKDSLILSCVQSLERKERQSFFKREQSTHYQELAGNGVPPPSYQVDPDWMQLGMTDQPFKVQFLISEQENDYLGLLSAFNHRLLSDNTARLLETGDCETIRNNALAMLFSPVAINLLPLEHDPFLLASDFMMNLGITKSSFFPNQGVLTVNQDGVSYAYMTIELDNSSASYLKHVFHEIEKAKALTLEYFPDVSINISGVPTHSARAIAKSIAETNLIAWASVILLVLISYAVFRSAKSFFYALCTVGVGIVLAFMLTSVIFGEIHVLVLVFGASLIGLCLDYHIHYFAERGISDQPWSSIGRAVSICLITSLAGFGVMMLSGVPILLQIAVFASIGLTNAYFIIRFLYPVFLPKTNVRAISPIVNRLEKRLAEAVRAVFRKHSAIKIAILVLFSLAGILQLRSGDDLKSLYKPEKDLIESEALFARVSGTSSAPVMVVIQGTHEQDVLEKEELFRNLLHDINHRAASQAIPSHRRQNRNFALTEDLYNNELDTLLSKMDTPQGIKKRMFDHLIAQKDRHLEISEIPDSLKFLLSEKNSVILVENATNKTELANLAREGGAHFSDRIQEISQLLNDLRERATIILLLVFAAVFSAIAIAYKSIREAFSMLIPAFLSVLLTLGILGFAGEQITLFNILALFLVICLGADYVIFRVEGRDTTSHTGTAIALSCLTTTVAFGALGFTSFAVTRALGITLGLGIAIAYLLSPLATLSLKRDQLLVRLDKNTLNR